MDLDTPYHGSKYKTREEAYRANLERATIRGRENVLEIREYQRKKRAEIKQMKENYCNLIINYNNLYQQAMYYKNLYESIKPTVQLEIID
jgi:hypothetical protein